MIEFLEYLMISLPLEVFVFIGTVIDEIISPIPAFLVLLPTGIAAHLQSHHISYLLLLGGISATARALAGYILYLLADKLEDFIFAKKRTFFGISHKNMERTGKQLGKRKPRRSWLALFSMHALPIFPGTLLSLGSGFIRLRPDIFITATLAGSFVSAVFFLYMGYAGVQTAALLGNLNIATQITTLLLFLLFVAWLFFRWHHNKKK